MKTIKTLFVAFFFFVVLNASAQLPTPAVWLKMDAIAATGNLTNDGDSTCNPKAKSDIPTVYTDSERGDVLSFATTTSKISLLNSGYLGVSGDKPRTYSVWIKFDQIPTSNVALLTCAANSGTSGNANLGINITNDLGVQSFIGAKSDLPNMWFGKYFSSEVSNDSLDWHMVSVVYEADTLYAYRDGVVFTKKHFCEGGLNTELKWVTLFDKFVGYASDFRIYEAALTPAQIQYLYSGPEIPTTTTKLDAQSVEKPYVAGGNLFIPASENFSDLKIFSLAGVNVMTKSSTVEQNINLSHLKSGIYVVMLTTKDGQYQSHKICL